jgi:hypothetical protein
VNENRRIDGLADDRRRPARREEDRTVAEDDKEKKKSSIQVNVADELPVGVTSRSRQSRSFGWSGPTASMSRWAWSRAEPDLA